MKPENYQNPERVKYLNGTDKMSPLRGLIRCNEHDSIIIPSLAGLKHLEKKDSGTNESSNNENDNPALMLVKLNKVRG